MRIVAIGGGDVREDETLAIDRRIIELSGTQAPIVVFVPTASDDAPDYIESIRAYYTKLGATVEALTRDRDDAEALIDAAHVIYVGGGSTRRLITDWQERGWDERIHAAGERGAVLCGLSAGANCWFTSCSTDSDIIEGTGTALVRIEALGWLPGLYCPHYDAEPARRETIGSLLHDGEIALCADNCAALEVDGERTCAIASKQGARVYRVRVEHGELIEEPIGPGWHDLRTLLKA